MRKGREGDIRGPWHGSIPSSLLAATASYMIATRYSSQRLCRISRSSTLKASGSCPAYMCLIRSTQLFTRRQKKPASPDDPTTRRYVADHALVFPSQSAVFGPMRGTGSLTEPLSMSRSQRPRDVMELAAGADREESLAISLPPIVQLLLITCPSSDQRLKNKSNGPQLVELTDDQIY